MINIRKEQKITIPLTYLEYLEPNFIFIPIKEKTSFPKVAVSKDNYIEDYWKLFMDALLAHDAWEYGKLQDEIFDKVWEDCGFTEIEEEDDEDGE